MFDGRSSTFDGGASLSSSFRLGLKGIGWNRPATVEISDDTVTVHPRWLSKSEVLWQVLSTEAAPIERSPVGTLRIHSRVTGRTLHFRPSDGLTGDCIRVLQAKGFALAPSAIPR